MRISLSLIITCLLIASVSCHNISRYDLKRITELRNEVADDLVNNLLPWWSAKMPDYENGGFYGRINMRDSIFKEADKAGILNARILWTYSAAYRITGDTSYLRLATRAKNYCLEYFIDKEFGGAYYTLDYKGVPRNTVKHIYTNSYFVYAFAEYSRATGCKEALDAAIAIFELIEEHAFDHEYNGYFEDFNREWERIHLRMLGTSNIDEKTQNTMLHLMEAYATLYLVWSNERMAERLRNLVELFLDKIIDPNTFHLHYVMDRELNSVSEVESYGHDIELAWLLREAALFLGEPQLIRRVEETSVKIAEVIMEKAIRPDGSFIYEKNRATGRINENRSWWAHAEAIVGFFDAWEISGDERFLDVAIHIWNFTRDNFIDTVNGGWFTGITPAGEIRGNKAGHWECPYHNGRMAMEIMMRVDKLTKK